MYINSGNFTQALILARQIVYHLSHLPRAAVILLEDLLCSRLSRMCVPSLSQGHHGQEGTRDRMQTWPSPRLGYFVLYILLSWFASVSAGTSTSWSEWWLQGRRAPVCTTWLNAQPSPCLLSRGGIQEASSGLSLTAVQEGKLFVQRELTNSP